MPSVPRSRSETRNVAAIVLLGIARAPRLLRRREIGRGRPGAFLSEFGGSLALLFALTGAINVAVYVGARAAVGSNRR